MDRVKDCSSAAERLRRTSHRYRLGRSAARFFAHLVRLGAPGAVCLLTVVFLSKILWPPLLYAVYLFPVWFLAVGFYLHVHPERWRVERRRADGLADLRSGSHGLYMTLQESGDAGWEQSLVAHSPKLKVRVPYGSVAVFLLLVASGVILFVLPDLRPAPPAPPHPTTPVERTEELVKLMEEAELADEQYLEKTGELLQDLRQQREEGLDAEDWQALDEAREELKRQAGQNWQQRQLARRELEQANRAVQEGRSLRRSEARQLAGAMQKLPRKELDAAMKKTAAWSGISQQRLQEILQRAASSNGALSKKECEALAELAGECQKDGPGAGEKKGLAALESAGFSEQQLQDMLASGEPGRGGINRGPGPAPLQHLGETTEGGQFQAKTFRGNQGEMKAQLGSGVVPADEHDESGETVISRGPSRSFGSGEGRITWHSRLLPRHNEVLKKYFREQETPRSK
jgi:hypothetical protein